MKLQFPHAIDSISAFLISCCNPAAHRLFWTNSQSMSCYPLHWGITQVIEWSFQGSEGSCLICSPWSQQVKVFLSKNPPTCSQYYTLCYIIWWHHAKVVSAKCMKCLNVSENRGMHACNRLRGLAGSRPHKCSPFLFSLFIGSISVAIQCKI